MAYLGPAPLPSPWRPPEGNCSAPAQGEGMDCHGALGGETRFSEDADPTLDVICVVKGRTTRMPLEKFRRYEQALRAERAASRARREAWVRGIRRRIVQGLCVPMRLAEFVNKKTRKRGAKAAPLCFVCRSSCDDSGICPRCETLAIDAQATLVPEQRYQAWDWRQLLLLAMAHPDLKARAAYCPPTGEVGPLDPKWRRQYLIKRWHWEFGIPRYDKRDGTVFWSPQIRLQHVCGARQNTPGKDCACRGLACGGYDEHEPTAPYQPGVPSPAEVEAFRKKFYEKYAEPSHYFTCAGIIRM